MDVTVRISYRVMTLPEGLYDTQYSINGGEWQSYGAFFDFADAMTVMKLLKDYFETAIKTRLQDYERLDCRTGEGD